MSYVYRARHPNPALGLRAIKVLRPELAVVEEYRTRFLREAEIGGGFDHENIVHIYDFGGGEGAESPPYMVMEFMQGSDLSAFISGGRTCDLEEKLRIARQMAAALAHIHQMGVFHRDVKPQNFIRRESDGRVKLIDFGIAKQQDGVTIGAAMTVPGSIVGTPHYMAPEQTPRMSGLGEVTRLVDVYAFGVVLFELMAGREWTFQLPQGKDTPAMVAFKWICERPLDTGILREADPRIPEAVSSLIRRCTEKDPEARIQSFTAIVEEIDHIQSSLSASNDEVPRLVRPSWLSGLGFQPRYLGLVGSGALLAVLLVLWAALLRDPEAQPMVVTDSPPASAESSQPGLGGEEPPIVVSSRFEPALSPMDAAPDGDATAAVFPPPAVPNRTAVAAPSATVARSDSPSAELAETTRVATPGPPPGNSEPIRPIDESSSAGGADGDQAPVEVSALDMEARVIEPAQPVYPDEARLAGVAGTVVLRAWVGRDGRVMDVARLTGDEVLARAAMDAVREWRYRPWSPEGGDPVDVVTSVVVRFAPRETAGAAAVPTPATPERLDGEPPAAPPIPPCSAPRQVTLATGQLASFAMSTETLALYLARIAPSLTAEGGMTIASYWLRTDQPWWAGDRIDPGGIGEQLSEASDMLGPGSYVQFTLAAGGRLRTAISPTESLEVELSDAGRTASMFTVCQGPPFPSAGAELR